MDDADNNTTNELQTLSLSGNSLILSITGDTVIIPSSTYNAGTGIDITGGTISNIGDADSDTTNELITNAALGPANNFLIINEGGTLHNIDVSDLNNSGTDNQNLTGATLTGTSLQIDIESGNSAIVDLSSLQDGVDDADNNPANEFNTGANLNGTNLEITDGGGTQTADLSSLTGTDNQNLTSANLSGTNLTIAIQNGNSTTVDLGPLQDGVDDADNNPANEFNTGATLNGTNLEITDGGGTQTADLSSLTGTDNQNLTGATLSGNTLTIDIDNGNSTTATFTDWDSDANDDITTSTTAGGDLSGTYPNPTVSKIHGTSVSSTAPTPDQFLVYDALTNTLVYKDQLNDSDWEVGSGIIYNENEDVGIGTTNPTYKLHVVDNSTPAIKNVALFETSQNYSTITTNTTNTGEGGGVFMSRYQGKNIAYVGGNYRPTDGDTTSFFGVGTPNNGSGSPELGMKINGNSKSIKLGTDEIKIGLESNPTNNSSEIVIGANNIYFHGNEDGAGNINQTDIFIDGDLQYSNGNQQNGYILQSDANGNADWVDPSTINPVINDWTLNGTHMYNANTGNIGIGTTSPNSKLNIVTSAGSPLLLLEGSGLVGGGLHFTYKNTNEGYEIRGDDQGGINLEASGNHKISFETNNDERMRITGNGNVGIGTDAPQSKLHIDEISSDAVTITTDWGLTMQHYNSGYASANVTRPYLHKAWDASNGDYLYLGSSGDNSNSEQSAFLLTRLNGIQFGKGNNSGNGLSTEWGRFDNSGNFGIGKTSPQNILHLSGNYTASGMVGTFIDIQNTFGSSSSAAKVGIRFKTSNQTDGSHTKGGIIYSRTSSNARGDIHFLNNSNDDLSEIEISNDSKMVIKNSGDVGIGTTTPSSKLDVNGDVTASNYKYSSAKTRYLTIGETDFRLAQTSSAHIYSSFSTGGVGIIESSNGVNALVTPVYLPQGATVSSVDVYYVDNSFSNMTFTFGSRSLTGTASTISTFATNSISSIVNSTSMSGVSGTQIDNEYNSYYLRIYSNGWPSGTSKTMDIKTVKITYTVSETD